MPSVLAIVQVRMSSQRYPGKVLHPVFGKPLLQYLIERLEKCTYIQRIVIATSREKSDDEIEMFCNKKQIPCYRGSLNDVASRFNEISEIEAVEMFVRINGDSPLIDQNLINKGIKIYFSGSFDLVTNLFPRTYPRGQSVEIIRTSSFKKIYSKMNISDDFEHVTNYFYRKPKDFNIFNFTSPTDYSNIHLSVDTPHDMQVFSNIIKRMTRSHWDYSLDEILNLYQKIIMME